jgi:Protein of unknown function, DUF481
MPSLQPLSALISILLLCPSAAFSADKLPESNLHDVVAFKNGDTLTGNIPGTTATGVDFSNPAVGHLTLKWADITSVQIKHAIRIVSGPQGSNTNVFNNPIISVRPESSEEKLLVEVRETGQPNSVRLENVQSIAGVNGPAGGTPSVGWRLAKFKLNTAILAATQHQQTYGAELDLVRNWHADEQGWPHQRTLVQLIPNYDEKRKNNKPGSANITQDYFGKLQHLIFINSDNFYASSVADIYRNNSLGLYFQQAYGGGLGVIVHDIELNADLRFIGQHFYPPTPSQSLVGSQLSERYSFSLDFIRPHTTLNETAIVTPVFNVRRAWQTQALVELVIPITAKLGFSLSASDYYVENAPPAFRKNYFKTAFGLQFSPAKKP